MPQHNTLFLQMFSLILEKLHYANILVSAKKYNLKEPQTISIY